MFYLLPTALLLSAAVLAGCAVLMVRRQERRAVSPRGPGKRHTLTAIAVVLQLVIAGGLFGVGLAILLDRYLGTGGIVLAAVVCGGVGLVAVYRAPQLASPGERA